MRKLRIIALLFLLLAGCSSSVIKVNVNTDADPYAMYGRIPQREFKVNKSATDSIKLIWEAEINGSFPGSSVTVYDGCVFVNDLSGRVYCFEINTGKTLGELKLKGAVYTTPVTEQTWLIFAAAQRESDKSLLYYYDYSNGKTVQEITIDGLILTELIKVNDGIIFNCENGLTAKYDFLGALVWETDTKNFTHSSPVIDNRIILFGNDAGEIIAVKEEDGSIIYRKKIAAPFFCGAAASGGTAYIGNDDGNLFAINMSSGEILWKFHTGSRILMVPAIDDQKIFIGNLKGDFFSLDKSSGKMNWVRNLGGVLSTSPLVTENKLIVPDLNEKVFIADKEKGEITSTYNFDGRVKLTPVFHKNFLFIGYDNGNLEAYEFY